MVSQPVDAVILLDVDESTCPLAKKAICKMGVGPQCDACVPGYFFDELRVACEACPQNSFKASYNKDTNCTLCDPDLSTLGLTGQSTCWGCPVSATFCAECAVGFIPGSPTCQACEPGTFYYGAACYQCAVGSYSTGHAQTACSLCEAGSYSTGDAQTSCSLCGPFSRAEVGQTLCVCVAGSTLDQSGTQCVPCPMGTFLEESACVPCPVGTFCGAEGCVSCEACAYAPLTGLTACWECVGTVIMATGCECPPGMFYYDPENPNDNSQRIQTLDECRPCTTECPPQSFWKSQCTPQRDTECQDCSPKCATEGYFISQNCTPNADIQCRRCSTACLLRRYMVRPCLADRDMQCARCLQECPPGHVITRPCGLDVDLECSPCPAGTYAPNMTAGCSPCAPGTISATRGASACIPCSNMTNVEQTICFEQGCVPGYYPLTYTQCALCPPMTFGPTGEGCVSCVGGNFWDWGATACVMS